MKENFANARLDRRRHAAWLLILCSLLATTACEKLRPLFEARASEKMPAYRPVAEVQTANQNWSTKQRQWFYHSGQGTMLLPYKWFLALEQPELKPFGDVRRFRETVYLARFGFLPDPPSPQNPDGLPVGFAKDTITDPRTGNTLEVVGLTCAACHTGQLEYQGKGVRIDGGSASLDLAAFQTELGFAVGFTDKIPFRFDRFAKAVLGGSANPEAKSALRHDLQALLAQGATEKQLAVDRKLYATSAGFGRTDALGRIGNFVFGTELDNANLRPANGPVSFPPVWYSSWFDWVQYNGSISQPMVRNIGEALGVRARVNLSDPQAGLFRSSVDVKNLHDIEILLAGPTAFSGLRAPTWPESIFGPIDRAKAEAGKNLYQQHCQHCHLPVIGSGELQDVTSAYWAPGQEGRHFLRMNLIPLEEIGTDPTTAADWEHRTALTGPLGLGTISAARGLQVVTDTIAAKKYDELGVPPDQRAEWNGFRDSYVRAPLAYKSRPLSGIWATPPFLHNGSVPSLYQMLIPADRRDKTFYTGSREFDPKHVGYASTPFENGFVFDTTKTGNGNTGHEFKNGPRSKGVIGPELTDEDRWAIIEYLKVM